MKRRPVTVGLVQINNSFSGQIYFPYSVGLLEAYSRKHLANPQDYRFLPPIFTRMKADEAAEQLMEADIVGFSTYVWNRNISLKITELLKAKNPKIVTVFGGPEVPKRPARVEEFLKQHPYVDIACHGEGEQIFASLLENCRERNWQAIPSISYLKEGVLENHPRAPRIQNLAEIPSPYLNNIFAPLIEANPSQNWIAMWETNRGCPFSCAYCDWGDAVMAKIHSWDLERLYREVEWFAAHRILFVFCADANFGILPRDIELARYCASVKQRYGYPKALSVQSTKNHTERSYSVQKILTEAGLNKGVVISMQSLNRQTLNDIKRHNISIESFQEIQRQFSAEGIETMTDIILGLPGETYDSFVDGVANLIENGQHNRIQFNNLSILENAEMGEPEYQRRYGMTIARSRIVNIHGTRAEEKNDVAEIQRLVVGTTTMPESDWARTRVFCWMTSLLHFNKILQIPLVTIRQMTGLNYRSLLELFSVSGKLADFGDFPLLEQIKEFFKKTAISIQNGAEEYCHSEKWLDMWWPADELMLIELCTQGKLAEFYAEARQAIELFLQKESIDLPSAILHDAIHLNQQLIKMPFQNQDLIVELSSNLWEFCVAATKGKPIPLKQAAHQYRIDRTSETWKSWEEWCQKVVWWGNKKGAYLYGNASDKQLAGHF